MKGEVTSWIVQANPTEAFVKPTGVVNSVLKTEPQHVFLATCVEHCYTSYQSELFQSVWLNT